MITNTQLGAEAAAIALEVFAIDAGIETEDTKTQIIDLLADLAHLCDREEIDSAEVNQIASQHYMAEIDEDES